MTRQAAGTVVRILKRIRTSGCASGKFDPHAPAFCQSKKTTTDKRPISTIGREWLLSMVWQNSDNSATIIAALETVTSKAALNCPFAVRSRKNTLRLPTAIVSIAGDCLVQSSYQRYR